MKSSPQGSTYYPDRASTAHPSAKSPPVAGVTEGALYRQFKGKEDLCQQAYFTIVADMASTKEMIALSTASVAEKMREWVRASYDYYDQFPDAFSYVFFTEHAFRQSWKEITTRQSRIFTRIIAQMQPTHSELALSHFFWGTDQRRFAAAPRLAVYQ